jgi:glycerophosphoryl diester phosphodiesterase
LISSFNHTYLTRIKSANPAIPTAALVENHASDPLTLVHNLGAMGYNPGCDVIHPEEIPAIREAGVEVYTWTVNDPAHMRALIDHHVSGIFTDFPQTLEETLR